jgi:hypothetical protein
MTSALVANDELISETSLTIFVTTLADDYQIFMQEKTRIHRLIVDI